MIAVYVSPEAMTTAQYNEASDKLVAAGAPEKGRTHHSCFGDDGHLMVFDIWDSQASYDAFAVHLMPILQEVGIAGGPPTIMPVVNVSQ